MKVLVVDDEKICRESLQTLLTTCKFDVRSASDGSQALDVSKTFDPDVAIIDWMLGPPMDGLGLAETLRCTQPATRIVITSGRADIEQQAPRDAPYEYLIKPFGLADLLALFGDART